MGKRKRPHEKFLRKLNQAELFGENEIGGLKHKNKLLVYRTGDKYSVRVPANALPHENAKKLRHWHTHPEQYANLRPSWQDIYNSIDSEAERPRPQNVGEAIPRRQIYSANPETKKVHWWDGHWDKKALSYWARHLSEAKEVLTSEHHDEEHPGPSDEVLENMGMKIHRNKISLGKGLRKRHRKF